MATMATWKKSSNRRHLELLDLCRAEPGKAARIIESFEQGADQRRIRAALKKLEKYSKRPGDSA